MKSVAAAALGALLIATPVLAESRTIDLPPFTSVSIASGINATVTTGETQSIEAEAPSSGILDELEIRVVNGKLEAWVDWNITHLFGFGQQRQLSLRIVAPSITSFESSSGADIVATGITGDTLSFDASSGASIGASAVSGADLRVEVSSGADVTVDGICTRASIEASSGAHIDANNLQCANVEAAASSGADAALFASASVKADASSGGNIVVHGNPPEFEEEESSGGDIERAN